MRPDYSTQKSRLRTLARAGGMIETAAVRLIGLQQIEAAAGANWPNIRERVFSGSLHIIEERLGERDLVIPCGEGFLLVFADAEPAEIQAASDQLRETLTKFYLGDEGLKALQASVRPQAIPLDQVQLSLDRGSAQPKPQRPVPSQSASQSVETVPIWSLRTHSCCAELCAAVIRGAHSPYVGYDPDFLLRGSHDDTDFLDTDLAILDHALAGEDLRRDGTSRPLGIQVHASTMQNRRAREKYFSWLPAEEERRTAISFISVAEIAVGTPMMSIVEWTRMLRQHFSRVVLDFHYSDHAIGTIRDAGAWMVSTHLPVHGAAQKVRFAGPTLGHLQFWTKSMHDRGMRLIVHGFQEPAFADRAAELGVDLATGLIAPREPAAWTRNFAKAPLPRPSECTA
jgi:hypothetical protein